MRDIGRKIRRYRLSRYGRSHGGFPGPWLWIALGAWLLWASIVSDHSFYQLWKLDRENTRQRATLARVEEQLRDLQRRTSDPRVRRQEAERLLREQNGMARPGEIIYRIQDDDSDSTGSGEGAPQ